MNKFWFLVLGGLIGLFATAFGFAALGLLTGIFVALALFELRRLSERISRVERTADSTTRAPGAARTAATAASTETQSLATPSAASGERPPAVTARTREARRAAAEAYPHAGRSQVPPFPDAGQTREANVLIERARTWLTSGNVPVKVGVIVSFFGVAFLLKYAVDRNLLIVPMWLRLVFAAIFGAVLLIVGWRLRHRMRTYALSLQGGGVGIIYLTVFAAFRLYGLLAPVPAFVLLVLITLPAALLAVAQNARVMAILAVTGGFLAPLLTSTGQGSHVALFSYYLLLNISIVGIALFKSWRGLNLVGFLFTFVIGTLWGYEYYRPEHFASTEPFLVGHFLLFQAAAILFALRQPPRLRGIVDGTLLFGTPVVAFALQAALLKDTEYGLAFSAVALAVFYGAVSWWLRRHGAAMGLLRGSCMALGVAFATVAVPLAFDARWTASTFAMEGAALVWLGVRQGGVLSRAAGIALIVLAGGAFLIDGWLDGAGLAVLNGNVLGGVLVSLAGLFAAWQLTRIAQPWARLISLALVVWGVGWWLATGLLEIEDRLRELHEYPVRVIFFSLSAAALSFAITRLRWREIQLAPVVLLPLLALVLTGRAIAGGHPFESSAALAWLLAAAAHLYVLRNLEAGAMATRAGHVAGVLLTATLLAWETHWQIAVETGRNAATVLVVVTLAVLCWWPRRWIDWPLRQERDAYVLSAGLLLAAGLFYLLGFSLATSGDPLPLPYIPVLNHYDLVTLAALAAGYRWTRQASDVFGAALDRRLLPGILGVAAFLLTTLAIVRGVHQYAGIPWRQTALLRSVEVQAALSIYWGMLGFAGMVLGARRGLRWLWLTGAALMTLVVAKLFLVDLGNSGTVARIVSFIGVGGLLLVVGYFAPAPPRSSPPAMGD